MCAMRRMCNVSVCKCVQWEWWYTRVNKRVHVSPWMCERKCNQYSAVLDYSGNNNWWQTKHWYSAAHIPPTSRYQWLHKHENQRHQQQLIHMLSNLKKKRLQIYTQSHKTTCHKMKTNLVVQDASGHQSHSQDASGRLMTFTVGFTQRAPTWQPKTYIHICKHTAV